MEFARLKKKIRDRLYCYLPQRRYYGRDFQKAFAFLEESQHWSSEQLEANKLERLQALLRQAQTQVPYYRELFKKLGLDSRDITSLDDFAQIPILSKGTLRGRLGELKADNFASYKPYRTQTSGTTSRMTTLYRSRYHEAFRAAVVWRFYHQHGHKFGDRWVNIVCRNFDPDSPVCEFNRIENCLLVNTYHIIRGSRQEIVDAIREFSPNLIWTHPSTLGILAKYIVSRGLAPIEVPLVAVYSEKLFPHVRRALEAAFPGRIIEYYANRENSFAAWGYADDHFYEVSEYCHLEVANRAADDATGDLITTSLHNYAVPLIRYDPGDVVKWHGYADQQQPYPVVELLGGRGKDVLVTRDGLTVPYFLAYIDAKDFNKLEKFQIEQLNIDEIILRVVPKANYNREQDEPLLLEYAAKSIAEKLKVHLEYVDDIPLTETGKYRSVISKLALEYFDRKVKS